MLAGHIALVAATALTSAAAYINVVEQPARIDLPPRALLAEWKISYKRGTAMQVSLAVLAALAALVAFAGQRDGRWAIGALLLLALAPYTLLGVMLTNRRLLAWADTGGEGEARAGVRRWGRLHAVRAGLGLVVTLLFLWATL